MRRAHGGWMMSRQVRAWLGRKRVNQARAVLPGSYNCWRCGRLGRAELQETAVVVFDKNEADSGIVMPVHADCDDSRVLPIDQFATYGDHERRDCMMPTLMKGRAALLFHQDTPMMDFPRGAKPVNLLAATQAERGLQIVKPYQKPQPAPGWSVHLTADGQMATVTAGPPGPKGTDTPWEWWRAPEPFEMDTPWVNAARRDGQVLILAGSFPKMPPDHASLVHALKSRYLAHGLASLVATA